MDDKISQQSWKRPTIAPIPDYVQGVAKHIIDLNGVWKFAFETQPEFWLSGIEEGVWADVEVPGECFMQGFNIKEDVEYAYKKQIEIPRDFKDKRIILRFDGVFNYARVWVNGHYIRDHIGGFTTWDCDITDKVVPGEQSLITVGFVSRSDDISRQNHFTNHNIGGILRNVKLFALPKNYISSLHCETDFDDKYDDAFLKISLSMSFDKSEAAKVRLSLKNPQGDEVPINININNTICFT